MDPEHDNLETLSSGPDRPPAFGGGRRTGARLAGGATALTTALALVLVGGVVTAAVRSGGSGTPPAAVVPSSAFAFAQVDLALGGGQEAAVSALLDRFPDSPTHTRSGSLRDRVLRAVFRGSSDPHVDYDRDVRPWLGDHVAVAGWMDDGRPQEEVLLQSKDDAAARTAIRRLDTRHSVGVAFASGYAVLAPSQTAADHAVAAAKKSALGDVAHYRDDVAALGGTNVVTGWVDGGGIMHAITSQMHGLGPLAIAPFDAMMGGGLGRLTSSRAAFGIRAASDYAELVVQQVGGSTAATPQPTGLLTHLPDRTLAAAEVADAGQAATRATGMLRMFGTFARPGSVSSFGSAGVLCTGGSCKTVPGTRPTPLPTPLPAATDPLTAIERATGLSLPGDVTTLLGPAAVIAYGGTTLGAPNVGVRSTPADLAAATTVAQHIRDTIAAHTPVRLTVSSAGSDLVVATAPTYASALATGGNLGGQPRFAKAMGDLPARVSFAAYVDLSSILPLVDHGQRDLDRLDALGMWSGRTSAGDRLQLRVVVR